MITQKPVQDCKCLVCGGAGRDTLYVNTRGEWNMRLDVVCNACGTSIDIASITGSSPLIDGFIARVHASIDPSTPEQRAAAEALEDAARKTRGDAAKTAAELEAKARKLRKGELP